MYAVIPFDPLTAEPALWQAYFNLCQQLNTEDSTLDQFISRIQNQLSRKPRLWQLIFSEEGASAPVMAICGVPGNATQTGRLLNVAFETVSETCSDSLFAAVTEALATFLLQTQADSVTITTGEAVILDIIHRLKARPVNTLLYYGVTREQFTFRFRKHETDAFLSWNGLYLQTYDYVPENLYTPFATLMTELMNDIVRSYNRQVFNETPEGLHKKIEQFKRDGVHMQSFLLFNYQQMLKGISFMLIKQDDPVALQELTGVQKFYRGKGIARTLKAVTTATTFQQHPQVTSIVTNCYEANKHIIRINEALGFTVQSSHTQYEISPAQLLPASAETQSPLFY